jgi:hypothetical protein
LTDLLGAAMRLMLALAMLLRVGAQAISCPGLASMSRHLSG